MTILPGDASNMPWRGLIASYMQKTFCLLLKLLNATYSAVRIWGFCICLYFCALDITSACFFFLLSHCWLADAWLVMATEACGKAESLVEVSWI